MEETLTDQKPRTKPPWYYALVALAVVVVGVAVWSWRRQVRHERAVQHFEALGGIFTTTESANSSWGYGLLGAYHRFVGKQPLALTLHRHPCQDSDLQHLRHISKLESLDLRNTGITDAGLIHLRHLHDLNTLDLSQNRQLTNAALSHLRPLAELWDLSLGDVRITDEGLAHIAELTSLEGLDISGTKIKGPGLRHLTGLPLQGLQLQMTEVGDAGVQHLWEINTLVYIDVSYTEVTEEGVQQLKNNLPDVQELVWDTPDATP